MANIVENTFSKKMRVATNVSIVKSLPFTKKLQGN